jgi:hypothetical protein
MNLFACYNQQRFYFLLVLYHFLIIKSIFMSFKLELDVAGKKVTVLNCSYALKQETDATGRPSTVTRGGKVNLTVESTGDTIFWDWMINNFERKDGKITFLKRDTNSAMKTVEFKEAYLVDYRENFDAANEQPVTETFTLSARVISVGGSAHENEWIK